MELVSPALIYLRWLIVRPGRKSTDEEVRAAMTELGLDYLSLEYIVKVRERLAPPVPFQPYDPLSTASRRFIIREGMLPIVAPDKDAKIALQLVRIPRAKEFIETALLTEAPRNALASYVTRFCGLQCTTKAIDIYRRLFWNTSRLDATQMRALLQYRVEMAGDNAEGASREKRALYAATKKASYTDPRRSASELPSSPISSMITLMRMGIMPNVGETSRIFENARSLAALKATEAASQDGPRDSHRALNYTLMVRHFTEVLETMAKPDEMLQSDLSRIALSTDNRPIPSIHELSDGKHTVDVVPLPEHHEQPGTDVDAGGSEGTGAGAGEAAGDNVSFPGSE